MSMCYLNLDLHNENLVESSIHKAWNLNKDAQNVIFSVFVPFSGYCRNTRYMKNKNQKCMTKNEVSAR